MQTTLRLTVPYARLGVVLASLVVLACGCGGSNSFTDSPPEEDLGDLAVLFFNVENQANIFRDQRLEITFNGPVAVSSVKPSTIHVYLDRDNDATSLPNCDPEDGDDPGEWLPGQFFVGLGQVTFVPDDFFAENLVYCLTIPSRQEDAIAPGGPGVLPLISNVQGNTMVGQYTAFYITGAGFSHSNTIDSVTPGDLASPGTLGVDPDTCIDIVQSRPINPDTVNGGTVQLVDQSTGTAVPSTYTFPTPQTIRVCPNGPLTDATIHILTITAGVEDTQGIGSNGGTYYFTTEFPPPDGNTTFMETFDDNFLEELSAAQLPAGATPADWAGFGMTPAGMVGRLAATVGALLPVGGQGTADLSLLSGTTHEINTDAGTLDGAPVPSGGGVASFLGDGTFQFRNVEIGGAITLEAFGTWPLEINASGMIQIDGDIDIHGDQAGDAFAGVNEPGGLPSSTQRAGGMPGGPGAPSNGTIGLNGSSGQGQNVPTPTILGEGAGCGGESYTDPQVGEVGGGGGGGSYFEHGWHGQIALNGVRIYPNGFGTAGQHDFSYGGLPVQANRRLEPLFPGSGGGGGASITDTPGGGGATGSGSMRLRSAGATILNGSIMAYGGRGGSVQPTASAPGVSGGGGGGSGGGLNFISADPSTGGGVNLGNGAIDVTGGFGGLVPGPSYSAGGLAGGHGATGLIVAEAPINPATMAINVSFPGPGPLQPTQSPDLSPIGLPPLTLNPPNFCNTFGMVANFPNQVNQTARYCDANLLQATMFYQANASVGQSLWIRVTDNGVPVGLAGAGVEVINPNYSGASLTTANVPSGGTASIVWQGAEESAPGSGMPRAGTSTAWTANIDILDTHELIRFRVNLTNVTLPMTATPPPAAAVLDVEIDYSFNL